METNKENQEEVIAYAKKYYIDNKEKLKSYTKNYAKVLKPLITTRRNIRELHT